MADIGDPTKVPLPVDISLSADDQFLFVNSFLDGFCRVYNVADPTKPTPLHEQKIGAQVNMVSQSWDGKRVYFTSSLLANWDKKDAANEQFLKAYTWDGKQLTPAFAIDFYKENLGRPHSASPILAGGLIYLLAEDGTGTVFKPGDAFEEIARALEQCVVTRDLFRFERPSKSPPPEIANELETAAGVP